MSASITFNRPLPFVHVHWTNNTAVGPFDIPPEWVERGTVLADCCNRRRNPDYCLAFAFVPASPYYPATWRAFCRPGSGCRVRYVDGQAHTLPVDLPAGVPVVPTFDQLPEPDANGYRYPKGDTSE